jgi:hypothetical protein
MGSTAASQAVFMSQSVSVLYETSDGWTVEVSTYLLVCE